MSECPSLPNEILYFIVDHLDPGDLENFSASCPLFESLAKNALKEHRKLQRFYTKVFIEGCHREEDHYTYRRYIYGMERMPGHHPLSLLTDICKNPQVAWYPRSLKVECLGHNEKEHADWELVADEELVFDEVVEEDDSAEIDEWRNDAVLVRQSMENYGEEIKDLVFNSGYFSEGGRERWFDHIRRGNRGAALGLLLTLLPNLETMTFDKYTWKARYFKTVVERITKPCGKNDSGSHKEGTKVLTKLSEVKLCGTDPAACGEEPDIFEDFDLAGYFAKLPSMKKVYAHPAKVHAVRKNNPWLEVGSCTSNIDEISLESGTLDATYVSYCLGSLKKLRKFNYDDSPLWDDDHALDRSGMEMVLKALLKHAKTSLEYLSLAEYWHPAEGSDSTPNPISLKPFEKLKQASLSCHLYAPVLEYDKKETQVSVHDGTKPLNTAGSDDSGLHTPNLFDVPKLVDILPSSMEIVEFVGDIAMKHMEAMLQGLVKHKADRLPHLVEVVFYDSTHWRTDAEAAMGKVLQEECNGIGIRLVLGNESRRSGYYPDPKSRSPEFCFF